MIFIQTIIILSNNMYTQISTIDIQLTTQTQQVFTLRGRANFEGIGDACEVSTCPMGVASRKGAGGTMGRGSQMGLQARVP
jgi:hypothetical protein